MKTLMRFFKDEEGVVMIEYGLIAALIGVACIALLIAIQGGVSGVVQRLVGARTRASAS